jgi:hypothetical protein
MLIKRRWVKEGKRSKRKKANISEGGNKYEK